MNRKIGVIGLGYVGLPLALEFAKKYKTIGFDINKTRVKALRNNIDLTNEVSSEDLKLSFLKNNLLITSNFDLLKKLNTYVITVPTPVDNDKNPDLSPIISATKIVSSILKKGDIIIYESTFYPGLTEEICVPIIVKKSNLKFNKDFFVGYSPERINPGDKVNTLTNIVKVTSGSNEYSAKIIDELYNSIIDAGTHLAPNIKTAEASKIIENTQRDINIAFANELSKIFELMEIDTNDALEAAATKWNFMHFKPGLVGGHCIGVDPYYLINKSKSIGYNPNFLISARNLNDGMGSFVAEKAIYILKSKNINVKKAKVLILGFTFKENCPDFRNTKVSDIYHTLNDKGVNSLVVDPLVDINLVNSEYNININNDCNENLKFDMVIVAVAHDIFKNQKFSKLIDQSTIVMDLKSFIDKTKSNFRL